MVKSKDDSEGGSSFAYATVSGGHAQRHNFKGKEEIRASIKIESTM
jgi:hypothetical protein